jgi:hypothetical protein
MGPLAGGRRYDAGSSDGLSWERAQVSRLRGTTIEHIAGATADQIGVPLVLPDERLREVSTGLATDEQIVAVGSASDGAAVLIGHSR